MKKDMYLYSVYDDNNTSLEQRAFTSSANSPALILQKIVEAINLAVDDYEFQEEEFEIELKPYFEKRF